jgi:nucleoside-diphosphate-sugar epimerase
MTVTKKKILIIGGGGFVGRNLSQTLRDKGYACSVADIEVPKEDSRYFYDINLYKVDMTDSDSLAACFSESMPDVVIMLASSGMSGKAMLSIDTEKINLSGAQCVLEACQNRKYGVQHLIYTSTYNVVFGGNKIENGTEILPYYPIESHTDYYSRSKCLAEHLILQGNSDKLKTMALRPAAIYGPGERRHFPRIVTHMDAGLFIFRIGSATVDWLHVDNFTHAFEQAVKCIYENKFKGGEAYFISDGTPIDSFEFLRPLCNSRHVLFPSIVIPLNFCVSIALFFEIVYYTLCMLFGTKLTPAPFLTQAEVFKVGQTHFMDISKAREELGYNPKITTKQGAMQMAEEYSVIDIHKDKGRLKPGVFQNFFRLSPLPPWVVITSALWVLYSFAYDTPDDKTDSVCYKWSDSYGDVNRTVICSWLEYIGLMLFQSRIGLQRVFVTAVIAHVFEAYIAYTVCRKHGIGFVATLLWTLQTFMLGYGSLGPLTKHFAALDKKVRQLNLDEGKK